MKTSSTKAPAATPYTQVFSVPSVKNDQHRQINTSCFTTWLLKPASGHLILPTEINWSYNWLFIYLYNTLPQTWIKYQQPTLTEESLVCFKVYSSGLWSVARGFGVCDFFNFIYLNINLLVSKLLYWLLSTYSYQASLDSSPFINLSFIHCFSIYSTCSVSMYMSL